nr:BLUF domain-containing protein [Pelagerythrobacter marinus]
MTGTRLFSTPARRTDIRQFVYISTAPSLPEGDVAAILATAVRNNATNGITGFLLYNGRNFLQMIEGQQAELIVLMNRLARDRRHHGMVRLYDRPTQQRACPEWAMERLWLADDPAERRDAVEAILPGALEPEIRQMVVNFSRLN